MKKIRNYKPSDKAMVFIGSVLMLLMLYPLVRLTLYAVPYYDDYAYGTYLHNTVIAGGSLWDCIMAAVEHTRMMWYAFQGTFSSIFFMSMMPAAFGEQYYFLGPLFLIVIFLIGIAAFVTVLVRGVLKADWYQNLLMVFLTQAFLIILIHSAQQGFYWYNGGMHYVGGYAHMLLMLSLLLYLVFVGEFSRGRLVRVKAVLVILGTMVYALFTSGSNFVTTLQGLVLVASLAGLGIVLKKKSTLLMIPAGIVYIIGFCVNVMAPGNNVRNGLYDGWGYSAPEAILRSFTEGFHWFFEFTGWGTLLFLLFLFPIIYRIVKASNLKFSYPVLVLLWSVCLYATGFTPSLYATGRIDLSRVRNVIHFTLQLLLIFNEVYWTGFVCRYLEKRRGKGLSWDGRPIWWMYGVWAVCFLLVFATTEDKIGGFSPYGAYYYIHSGEAYNFRQAYLQRVEIIKQDNPDVEVEEYIYRPWFLCQTMDFDTNPEAEINVLTARYYFKNSIRLKPKEKKN